MIGKKVAAIQKPILAVDIDSTIADITTPLLDLIRRDLGKNVAKGEMAQRSVEELVGDLDKLHRLRELVWADPDGIPLVDPDIPRILAALQSKYEIHILTATLGDEATVRQWLADHNVPYDKYVHVPLETDKKDYNADVFIDDNYAVAAEISARNKRVLLVKQPWNEALAKIHTPRNVTLIDEWGEAEKLLLQNMLRR